MFQKVFGSSDACDETVCIETPSSDAMSSPTSTRTWPDDGFPSVVELNVGGFRYSTSLQTLRVDEYSMLAAMFRGGESNCSTIGLSKDSQGAYFIDYDGSCFGELLNFLRDDGSFIIPVDSLKREKLRRAALYFQVLGLVKLLEEASFTTKVVNSLSSSVNEGAKATAIRTLATVGAFGFRFVIFGLIVPLD
jgi:hypothetical protein